MGDRITPEVGKIYRRNGNKEGGPNLAFDMAQGCTIRVIRVTSMNVIGQIVSGNGSFSPGSAFNPLLRDFTTEYFDQILFNR